MKSQQKLLCCSVHPQELFYVVIYHLILGMLLGSHPVVPFEICCAGWMVNPEFHYTTCKACGLIYFIMIKFYFLTSWIHFTHFKVLFSCLKTNNCICWGWEGSVEPYNWMCSEAVHFCSEITPGSTWRAKYGESLYYFTYYSFGSYNVKLYDLIYKLITYHY